MPWSDDTRCLFCDGKLPLLRKFKQGQFCSKEHQDAYWKEQDQLAVEALHRTHDALQAYRPKVAAEDILGPTPGEPTAGSVPAYAAAESAADVVPELGGPKRHPYKFRPIAADRNVYLAGGLFEYELSPQAQRPCATSAAAEAGLRAPVGPQPVAAPAAAILEASWVRVEAEAVAPAAGISYGRLAELPTELSVPPARLLSLPLDPCSGATAPRGAAGAQWGRQVPSWQPRWALRPQGDLLDRMEQQAFPFADRLLALAAPAGVDMAAALRHPVADPALADGGDILHPQVASQTPDCAPPAVQTLRHLAIPGHAAMPVHAAGSAQPLPTPGAVALRESSLPIAADEPGMAGLVRLAGAREVAPVFAVTGRESAGFVDVAATPSVPGLTAAPVLPAIRVQAHQLQPLSGQPNPTPAAFVPRGGRIAEPFTGELLQPRLRVEPVTPGLGSSHPVSISPGQILSGVANFWNQAPRDLKILLFLIPLALTLALHPTLPKVSVRAPQPEQEIAGKVEQVVDSQWARLRRAMADRAAVGLDENFRAGLDNWLGNSGSTAEWAYDQAGFVLPGRVALYQPSLGLTDYELQFLGAVDKGALSWVVRASDFHNYYVVKLVVLKGGPLPQLGVTRYAVINGVPVDREDTPVALNSRADTLYRIRLEVQGDHYALAINGQMIDSWTETRLKRGGVGFFTNRGEQSRIGWVQVTHQYDTLGRLFAYLAP